MLGELERFTGPGWEQEDDLTLLTLERLEEKNPTCPIAAPPPWTSAAAEGGASIIDIRGQVTAAAEETLMDAYTQATAAGATKVLLNFSGLDYMNSSGIGLLVTLLIRANRQGQQIAAFGLTPHYRDIFELTRLDEAIHIFDTQADALAGA